MGKVEPIKLESRGTWHTKINGNPYYVDSEDGDRFRMVMLLDKLNELIAAHNEHIESCKQRHTPTIGDKRRALKEALEG